MPFTIGLTGRGPTIVYVFSRTEAEDYSLPDISPGWGAVIFALWSTITYFYALPYLSAFFAQDGFYSAFYFVGWTVWILIALALGVWPLQLEKNTKVYSIVGRFLECALIASLIVGAGSIVFRFFPAYVHRLVGAAQHVDPSNVDDEAGAGRLALTLLEWGALFASIVFSSVAFAPRRLSQLILRWGLLAVEFSVSVGWLVLPARFLRDTFSAFAQHISDPGLLFLDVTPWIVWAAVLCGIAYLMRETFRSWEPYPFG